MSVISAVPRPVNVTAVLYTEPTPGLGLVTETARANLVALLDETLTIGRTVGWSAIAAALHVPGVARVSITEPLADIVLAGNEVAVAGVLALSQEAEL